jgi:prolyl oligopeptidase
MIKLKNILVIFIFSNIIVAQQNILPERPFSEVYFGRTIEDSYHYIEGGKDKDVEKWFKQNSVATNTFLNNISGRNEILNQLIKIDKRITFNIKQFTYVGDYCFYLKKNTSDKNSKLYFKNSKHTEEILLFDPKNYKKESGNEYIINYIKPSWNNRIVALGLSKGGEEIGEIAFLDIASKTLLSQTIDHSWPSELGGVNWLPDNSGIIYVNIPIIDPNDKNFILNTESVLHKLADNAKSYKVLLSKSNNPNLNIDNADFPIIDKFDFNDKYITGLLGSTSNYINYYYAKIEELYNDKINWQPLFKKEDGLIRPIIMNNDFYCMSAKDSPNFKIIKTSIQNPDFKNPEIIVHENATESISDYVITKHGLFYVTTRNGVEAKLYFVDESKKSKPILLPIKAGTILLETKDKSSAELWVTISGWLNAKERYTYDVLKNEFKKDNVAPATLYPEFKDFVVEEIEIPSHDGVQVPVSLIYNKTLKKDKSNNILITGYGAYGISITPSFKPQFLSWVMNGGVYVIVHARGGGEKGDDWHKAGYKSTKPNTWKDLIATADYLIKKNITTNKKIAVFGRSAGGIIVGRAVTERPDLFKVMLCENGDLNTSRIANVPNGPNSMKEFGDPVIEEEFNALQEMDSYQHIKKGTAYPATLISVGMNDARVAPWMSGKFIAKLQAANTSKNPILFKVDYDAGHGLDNSNLKLYSDFADQFAFAFWQLGNPNFKLKKRN